MANGDGGVDQITNTLQILVDKVYTQNVVKSVHAQV